MLLCRKGTDIEELSDGAGAIDWICAPADWICAPGAPGAPAAQIRCRYPGY
jgi:hypothetical protein